MASSVNNPTTPFTYQNGDNPMRDIIERFDAIVNKSPQSLTSTLISQPVTVAALNSNTGITIPANSLIESIGVLFVEDIIMPATSTFNIGFGTASGNNLLVASTEVGVASTTIAANSYTSTNNGSIAGLGGAAIVVAVDAPLYSGTTTTDIWVQTTVGTAVLTSTSSFKVIVNYRGL